MDKTLAIKSESGPIINLPAIEAELRPQSPEKLRSTFVESYGKAALFIARAAVCVKLLEERGESLHGIPQLGLFRRVASGQVLPELVWKFLESPARNLVERAPLNDQRKLADCPTRPVVEPAAGGGWTTRMVDLTRAPVETVKQVIGPDGLREPEDQIIYLNAQKRRPAPAPAPAHEPAAEPLDRSVTVRLTVTEMAALKVNAARAFVTESAMARRGLVKSGVLKEGKV